MARGGPWRPGYGLALSLVAVAAYPVMAQRIGYAPVAPGDYVSLHGMPWLAVPKLPPDARVAPDDFQLDGDDEELSPDAQQRAADRLALARLSQNYRPRPAIWRIRAGNGNRTSTIYLFGTIHILPPGFQWRSAALDRVVAGSDSLLLESVDDSAQAPMTWAATAPLAARVSADHRAALRRFMAGLPPGADAQLDGMPSWVAAIAIGYVRDVQAGEIPGPGADDWLEARFRGSGKPVAAIEDARMVMAHIAAIPEAEQRAMLDAAIDAKAQTRAERRAATHAWAKGEVEAGSSLAVEFDAGNGGDALSGALLRDRNRAWSDTLIRRLRLRGTTLFAAGAGHFIGPGSVLELLKKRHIRVERFD